MTTEIDGATAGRATELGQLWSTRRDDGVAPVTLARHPGEGVSALGVLADGRVVAAGFGGPVRVFRPDAPDEPALSLGYLGGMVVALAGLPDGRLAAVVSEPDAGHVVVLDPADGVPVTVGAHGGGVDAALAVLPDARLVTHGADGRLVTWPTVGVAEPLVELATGMAAVAGMAVRPDGSVVTHDIGGRLAAWDPGQAGGPTRQLGEVDDAMLVVALPDGAVATAGTAGLVMLWAGCDGKPAFLGEAMSWVKAMAVRPDGTFVTGGADGRILAWDPTWRSESPMEVGVHPGVAAVVALPDGRLVTGSSDQSDGRILLWGRPAEPAVAADPGVGHRGEVSAVAVLGDGSVVSGGSKWDRQVLYWRADDPATPVELAQHRVGVRSFLPRPDGRIIMVDTLGELVLVDPSGEVGPVGLGNHGCGVDACLDVLPDGRLITAGWEGQIRLWALDPAGPAVPAVPAGKADSAGPGSPIDLGRATESVTGLVVLADGRFAISREHGRIELWDPAGQAGSTALASGPETDSPVLAVLPDGRIVSADCLSGVVVLRDPARPAAEPAQPAQPVEVGRHDGGVFTLVTVGGIVVTVGWDRRALVWLVPGRGDTPIELPDVVHATALPDGRLITGGPAGLVVWNPSSWTAAASWPYPVDKLAAGPAPDGATLVVAVTGRDLTCFTLPAI